MKHAFHNLGKAPFRVASFYKNSLWETCDCCKANGIRKPIKLVAVIEDCAGKRFKVGSVCVKKSGDDGLISAIRSKSNLVINTELHNLLTDDRIVQFLKDERDYNHIILWLEGSGKKDTAAKCLATVRRILQRPNSPLKRVKLESKPIEKQPVADGFNTLADAFRAEQTAQTAYQA